MGSVQFVGLMGNARLPDLSPSLAAPLPPIRNKNGKSEQICPTISAGKINELTNPILTIQLYKKGFFFFGIDRFAAFLGRLHA